MDASLVVVNLESSLSLFERHPLIPNSGYDTQTWEEIQEFALPQGIAGVRYGWGLLAVSPDGKTLVAGIDEVPGRELEAGHLYAWDVNSGKLIFKSGELPSHELYIPYSVSFSQDGQKLMMSDLTGTAIIWNAHNGEYIRTYGKAQPRANRNIRSYFTPSGILIAIGDIETYTSTVSLWDEASGELLQQEKWASPSNWIEISGDRNTLALGFVASQIALLDINTWQKTDLFGHTFAIFSLAFTPDNRYLLSGSADNTIRLWNLKNDSEIRQLKGSASFFSSFVLSPDGHTAISQEYFQESAGRLLLWNLDSGELVRSLAANEELLRGVAFSPDSKTVVSGSVPDSESCPGPGSIIHISDVSTGKIIWEKKKDVGSIFGGATFTHDGRRILTVDWQCENFVTVWDAANGEKLAEWNGHVGPIWSINASHNGKWVATGSTDKTAILWDEATGTVIHTLAYQSPVVNVLFSPDDQLLLIAEQTGTMHLWDVASDQELKQFTRHGSSAIFMGFSPDGRYVVSSSGTDGNIFVWDVQTGDVIRQFHQPIISPIGSVVAFSPDGQSIYFSDNKNIIHQVDLMLKPGELMSWIRQNRYIRDLTCGERELYRIEPGCKTSP